MITNKYHYSFVRMSKNKNKFVKRKLAISTTDKNVEQLEL